MRNKESSPKLDNEEMLRSGNYWLLARKLCIPAILIMVVMVLYNMADIFFIGQTGDSNKVTAVTLASPMFAILSGLGVLLGSGGCTAISLALGKENKRLLHLGFNYYRHYLCCCCTAFDEPRMPHSGMQ